MLTRHSPLHAQGGAEAGLFSGESQFRGRFRRPELHISRDLKFENQKKSAGYSSPFERRERTAAVQTVILDPSCNTGILPGRNIRMRLSKLETSTRAPGRSPNDIGPHRRGSRFLLILRNVRTNTKKNLLDRHDFLAEAYQRPTQSSATGTASPGKSGLSRMSPSFKTRSSQSAFAP